MTILAPLALLVVGLGLSSCVMVRAPSDKELRALDDPPPQVERKVDRLFPAAMAWYENVEARLLSQGRPLSAHEREIAREFGVVDPGRVRIVVLERFPMPEDPELRAEAERYGMGSALEGGRTIGYVIMLKPQYAENATIIAHELVHVAQHDRLGRAVFLRRYLVEMEMMGYARAPLELEAYERQGSAR